jgi:hypothetical protein
MQTTHIVIISLSVLNIGILMLTPWLDRRLYEPVKLRDQQLSGKHFFNNTSFDEPFNRFMLSKGGILILSLVFAIIFS